MYFPTINANKMNEFGENYELSKLYPDLSRWVIKKETGENIELFANKLCAEMILQVNLFATVMNGAH